MGRGLGSGVRTIIQARIPRERCYFLSVGSQSLMRCDVM